MIKIEEAILEPFARAARFWRGIEYFPQGKGLVVADLGCGPKLRFLKYLAKLNAAPARYIGVDPLIDNEEQLKRTLESLSRLPSDISIVRRAMNKTIPLGDASVDVVVAFAFLEHIDHPQEILADVARVLKPGGRAILTTPTPKAKALLEWLSFKLGLISKREIEEHKNYFNQQTLLAMARSTNLKVVHRYFEFGLNNLLVMQKPVLKSQV